MTIEIITPESRAHWLELRMPLVGASESPAMLGVSPYMTPFDLWAKKSRVIVNDDSKQMRRGRLLQPIVIDILREERPSWTVTSNPFETIYCDRDAGISCTPDCFVSKGDGLGICQIKTVNTHAFQGDWMIDGEVQLPPYVAIQTMQEAYLTGASWACVAAIVGFDLDFYLIDVEIHAGVIARIKREAPDFLRRVRENDPPPPDYARDSKTIAALYADDDGGMVDLSGNERVLKLIARREAMKEIEGAASEAVRERRTIDAELVHHLGNAVCGTLADGRVIEAKTVRRAGYAVEPTSYRAVKIKHRRIA